MENSLKEVLSQYLECPLEETDNFTDFDIDAYFGELYKDEDGTEFAIFKADDFVKFVKVEVFPEELQRLNDSIKYSKYTYIAEEDVLEDLLFDDDAIENALNIWKIHRNCEGYIILEN